MDRNEIEKSFMKQFHPEFVLDQKIPLILSVRQKEDKPYYFLNPLKVVDKLLYWIKDDEEIPVEAKVKKIYRNKRILQNKLSLQAFGEEIEYFSTRQYKMKCLSCGSDIKITKINDLYKLLKGNGIFCPKCRLQIAHRTDSYHKRFKKSMIEKYGADHPNRVPEIKKKIRSTMIARYGAPSPFHNGILREKHYQTMMKKYGQMSITGENNVKASMLEKEFTKSFIEEYSKKYDIKNIFSALTGKQWFLWGKKGIFWRSFVDIYIRDIKLVIQIHGDFWHGNLKTFNAKETHPVLGVTFEELRKQSDEKDRLLFENKDVKTYIVVWESSIYKNKNNIIQKIMSIIEKGQHGFFTL